MPATQPPRALSRALLLALAVTGCGRIGFDSVADRPGDAGPDARPAIDSAPADAGVPRFGRFVATDSDEINDVAVHPVSGDIYITGKFRTELSLGGDTLMSADASDMFVARFAADGSHRWSARFGGPGTDEGVELAVGPDSGVVIVGHFANTIDFGGGPLTASGEHDMFIASFASDGTHRWSARYGGDATGTPYGSDGASGVAIDDQGNVIVSGHFTGTTDFGGGPLTSQSPTGYDIFITSYTADGGHRWTRQVGEVRYNIAFGLSVDPAGNIYATGMYEGTPDFGGGPLPYRNIQDAFVVSYNRNGQYRWHRDYGAAGFQWGLATVPSGDVIGVVGFFENTVDFGQGPVTSRGERDGFFLGLDAATGADRLPAVQFGTSGCDVATAVAAGQNGQFHVAGSFSGTLDIGPESLVSAGSSDGFMVTIDAQGAPTGAWQIGANLADKASGVAAWAGSVYVVGELDDDNDPCQDDTPVQEDSDAFFARVAAP